MRLDRDQREQSARLFGFLLLGEHLAHDCAREQSKIAPDRAARRFLAAQARQEAFHAKVFERAVQWLAPRRTERRRQLAPIQHYRALVERALRRRDFAESLLAQHVILEGLGDVVCERISRGIANRALDFSRLRHLVLHQEQAHHTFGMRRLARLVYDDPRLVERLRPRGLEYLGLVDATLTELSDLFGYFDENPSDYRRELQRHLPPWLGPAI